MYLKTEYPLIQEQVDLAIAANDRSINDFHVFRDHMREAMLDLRLKMGMTARTFGSLCGVSKAYIYSLEKGNRPWNLPLVDRLISSLEDM